MAKIFEQFKGIENVIFDLGNVVLDIDIQRSIDGFKNLNIDGLKAENVFPSPLAIFEEYERGLISSMQFFDSFKKEYGIKELEEVKFWGAWNALLKKFDPERIKLIKELGKNYNVYLLSNTNAEHVKFFNNSYRNQFGEEFCKLFKRCFYSNEMKTRKPDSDIYEILINQTGINPQKSVFIDDLEQNVVGARKLGLNGYYLTSNETILDIF